jgi:hypothetical protein
MQPINPHRRYATVNDQQAVLLIATAIDEAAKQPELRYVLGSFVGFMQQAGSFVVGL